MTVTSFDQAECEGNGRCIHGMTHYLDLIKLHSGAVEVEDASIYWWLVDDKKNSSGYSHGVFREPGHCGMIFDNEIYHRPSSDRFDRLRKFGIYLGQERLVIYVKPDPISLDVGNSDLSRSSLSLRKNGEVIDIDDFYMLCGKKFIECMPKEITAYLDELHRKYCSPENDDAELADMFGYLLKGETSPHPKNPHPHHISSPHPETTENTTSSQKIKPPRIYWLAGDEFPNRYFSATFDGTSNVIQQIDPKLNACMYPPVGGMRVYRLAGAEGVEPSP